MDALDLFPTAGIRFLSVQHEQNVHNSQTSESLDLSFCPIASLHLCQHPSQAVSFSGSLLPGSLSCSYGWCRLLTWLMVTTELLARLVYASPRMVRASPTSSPVLLYLHLFTGSASALTSSSSSSFLLLQVFALQVLQQRTPTIHQSFASLQKQAQQPKGPSTTVDLLYSFLASISTIFRHL